MIVMYVTGEDGNGYIIDAGHFDSIDEIKVRVGLFAKDTVISFEEKHEQKG